MRIFLASKLLICRMLYSLCMYQENKLLNNTVYSLLNKAPNLQNTVQFVHEPSMCRVLKLLTNRTST